MLIKELKEKIKDLPDNMDVFIKQENTEFGFSNVEKAEVITAGFSEEPGGKVLAKDKVFILTDEI